MYVVDAVGVGVEGFDPLVLVVALVEGVEDGGDGGFVVVDAVLDEFLFGEVFVSVGYDLVDEGAAVFLLLLLAAGLQGVGAVQYI